MSSFSYKLCTNKYFIFEEEIEDKLAMMGQNNWAAAMRMFVGLGLRVGDQSLHYIVRTSFWKQRQWLKKQPLLIRFHITYVHKCRCMTATMMKFGSFAFVSKQPRKNSWDIFGAKRWFYFSTGTGPVGRRSCTRVVRSDWLYIFKFVEGMGIEIKFLRYFETGFQDLEGQLLLRSILVFNKTWRQPWFLWGRHTLHVSGVCLWAASCKEICSSPAFVSLINWNSIFQGWFSQGILILLLGAFCCMFIYYRKYDTLAG